MGPGYGGMPPGAQPPAGGYFKSGKGKTIGLIVAGVVAVGAIGGVAALLLGGGDEPKPSAEQPQTSGVLDPTPVSNTDSPSPSPSPTEEPTEEPSPTESASPEPTPTPTPEPSPTPEPQPDGDTVTIGEGVQVVVPDGWEVLGQGETDVALADKHDNWVYAVTGTVKPSAQAANVLRNSIDNVLPPDNYTQREFSDVITLQPYGSVVSVVAINYTATWVDSQASIPLFGTMFAAVRQDGTALIMTGEHSPPDEYADNVERLAAVIDTTLGAFGS
jgi:hypothetical protein